MLNKLYRYVDGKVEVVTILRDEIAAGASVPSCLVRYEDGTKAWTSKRMFHASPLEAMEKHCSELKATILSGNNEIKKIQIMVTKAIQELTLLERRVDKHA